MGRRRALAGQGVQDVAFGKGAAEDGRPGDGRGLSQATGIATGNGAGGCQGADCRRLDAEPPCEPRHGGKDMSGLRSEEGGPGPAADDARDGEAGRHGGIGVADAAGRTPRRDAVLAGRQGRPGNGRAGDGAVHGRPHVVKERESFGEWPWEGRQAGGRPSPEHTDAHEAKRGKEMGRTSRCRFRGEGHPRPRSSAGDAEAFGNAATGAHPCAQPGSRLHSATLSCRSGIVNIWKPPPRPRRH
jgi:hypothetical protein